MTIPIYARGTRPPRVEARLSDGFDLIDHLPSASHVRAMLNTSSRPFGAEEMDALPQLAFISNLGVGYEMIDVDAAKARGIVVSHTPDVMNADVANYALALILSASRNLTAQDAHVRSGCWADQGPLPLTQTVEGATFGIAGLGRIGRTLARKLEVFAGTILYFGRTPQPNQPYEFCPDLTAMARRCDVLVLLLPGGAGTHGIVDMDVLHALGPKGMLVNIARGSVLDEAALIDALQSGKLGRAALDVFSDEPNVPKALRDLPNVLLSPHAASATIETRRAMFDLTADNLISWIRTGAPLTPIPECVEMAGNPG